MAGRHLQQSIDLSRIRKRANRNSLIPTHNLHSEHISENDIHKIVARRTRPSSKDKLGVRLTVGPQLERMIKMDWERSMFLGHATPALHIIPTNII